MHDMAHGVSIEEEKITELIKYANKKLSEIQFDVDEVEVDYIFTNSNLNLQMLTEFGEAIYLYGNGIPQPKFAFELKIPVENIKLLGKNSDTIKFTVSGIDFLKFKDKNLKEEINNSSGYLEMKIIGRSQINSWMSRNTTQVIIDNYEIKKIELNELF